jgi:hypothetical protein
MDSLRESGKLLKRQASVLQQRLVKKDEGGLLEEGEWEEEVGEGEMELVREGEEYMVLKVGGVLLQTSREMLIQVRERVVLFVFFLFVFLFVFSLLSCYMI